MLSPNQTRFNLGRGWLSHPTVPRIPNGYRWSPISPLSRCPFIRSCEVMSAYIVYTTCKQCRHVSKLGIIGFDV